MATTTFDNLITFSRGSNATVTGPNGLIQWAPNNLQIQSETFNDVAWGKAGSTISANIGVAPFGSTTADKIVEDTSTGVHEVSGTTLNITPGQTYAATFFLKADGRSLVRVMQTWNGTTDRVFADFDLSNGSVGTASTQGIAVSAAPPVITNLGNGWYRCQISGSCPTGTTLLFYARMMSAAGVVSYTGDGSSGVQIWGAQVELGSTATTYNNTSVRNLLGFSEAFDNAAWTKGNSSIVTGAQANPVNGLFNAQKLMENTANAEHSCRQSASGLIASTPITVSVYLKAAERTIARVLNLDGANFYGIFVDLATGSFISTSTSGTFSNGSYSIASVGSGWFRVSVTATIAGTARSLYINTGVSGPSASYTGDGNSGVYIYGAQLSNSASLDPYVPTPGAAPSSTAYYGPRFDYDPVTLLPRGFLVEEARTNLLLNSVFGGAVSGTPGTAPTSWGSFTNGSIVVTSLGRNFAANSIRITTTSARHFYSQTVALAATGTWIITFKVNVGTAVRIDELLAFNTRPAGSTIQYFYNDAAQVASYVPPTGSGVLQVTVTTTGTSGNAEIRFGCGASNAVTADVTFWDAQWELGTFATSYIPTIASTVTRSADVATITGSLFSQWYRQAEGTIIVSCSYNSLDSLVGLCGADAGSGDNAHVLRAEPAVYRALTRSAGATTSTFVLGAGMVPAGSIAAYAYASNNTSAYANGLAATGTSGALPAVNLTQFTIGAEAFSTFLNGHIRSIRYVPVRAADFQLQQVTT